MRRDIKVGVHGIEGALKHDHAFVNHRDPIEDIQLGQIMNDANEGLLPLVAQTLQDSKNLVLRAGVETAGDLIANHTLRVANQFEAEPEAAQLPTTQVGYPLINVIGQPDPLKDLAQAGFFTEASCTMRSRA